MPVVADAQKGSFAYYPVNVLDASSRRQDFREETNKFPSNAEMPRRDGVLAENSSRLHDYTHARKSLATKPACGCRRIRVTWSRHASVFPALTRAQCHEALSVCSVLATVSAFGGRRMPRDKRERESERKRKIQHEESSTSNRERENV